MNLRHGEKNGRLNILLCIIICLEQYNFSILLITVKLFTHKASIFLFLDVIFMTINGQIRQTDLSFVKLTLINLQTSLSFFFNSVAHVFDCMSQENVTEFLKQSISLFFLSFFLLPYVLTSLRFFCNFEMYVLKGCLQVSYKQSTSLLPFHRLQSRCREVVILLAHLSRLPQLPPTFSSTNTPDR